MKFEATRYWNQDTERYQWAVYASASQTWYFPTRRGEKAAKALAERLNKEAN